MVTLVAIPGIFERLEEMVITKDRVQAKSGRIMVRLSLTCAWCARELENVEGEREPISGRVLLAQNTDSFRLLGGRPVCAQCGGPLFIENWRTVRVTPRLTARDFEDEPLPIEEIRAA